MKITFGTTELTVLNCYPFRYNNGKLVLRIEVPQSEIGHDELRTKLKENTADITYVRDDSTTESFSGFYYNVLISDAITSDNTEIHSCEIECVSENTYQISVLKTQVDEYKAQVNEYEAKLVKQEQTINAQNAEIELLNNTMLEMLLA